LGHGLVGADGAANGMLQEGMRPSHEQINGRVKASVRGADRVDRGSTWLAMVGNAMCYFAVGRASLR